MAVHLFLPLPYCNMCFAASRNGHRWVDKDLLVLYRSMAFARHLFQLSGKERSRLVTRHMMPDDVSGAFPNAASDQALPLCIVVHTPRMIWCAVGCHDR